MCCGRDNHVKSNCFIKYPHLKTKILKLQKANYNVSNYRKKRRTVGKKRHTYDSGSDDSSYDSDESYESYDSDSSSDDDNNNNRGRYGRTNTEYSNVEVCCVNIDDTFNDNFLGYTDNESENCNDDKFTSIEDNFLSDYKQDQLELIEEEPDDNKDFERGSVIDSI